MEMIFQIWAELLRKRLDHFFLSESMSKSLIWCLILDTLCVLKSNLVQSCAIDYIELKELRFGF